jgi:hypothetical protein
MYLHKRAAFKIPEEGPAVKLDPPYSPWGRGAHYQNRFSGGGGGELGGSFPTEERSPGAVSTN